MSFRGPRWWLLVPTAFFAYIAYAEKSEHGTLAFLLIVTGAVWLYDNRYVLNMATEARGRTAEQLRIQNVPARTTLPTPEESRLAQAQLQVAWNIIERAQKEKLIDHALSVLEEAALPLSKVRELDPQATILVKLDKRNAEPSPVTHDRITAFLLYLESTYLDSQAEQRTEHSMDVAMTGDSRNLKNIQKAIREIYSRSEAAIRRAVEIEPDHIPYLMHLVEHADEAEQRKIIAHVLKMEPYNVQALEISNRLK